MDTGIGEWHGIQDATVDRGEAKSEMQKFRFVEEIGP